jgi:hypothetical protein
VAAAFLGQERRLGEALDGDARPGTRYRASSGRPKCRERATYVRGPGHCERLADRPGSSNVPGCGARSRGVRGIPAGCITEGKKTFCCVTMRRRKFRRLIRLGRGLGLVTALSLRSGVLGLGVVTLATFRLPLRRQPAADFSQAFRILAVSLVPTPRLVLAPAIFVEAGPRARATLSGLATVLSINVVVAHGSFALPRESPRRMRLTFSSGAIKTRTKRFLASLSASRERDKERNGVRVALQKRRQDQQRRQWCPPHDQK